MNNIWLNFVVIVFYFVCFLPLVFWPNNIWQRNYQWKLAFRLIWVHLHSWMLINVHCPFKKKKGKPRSWLLRWYAIFIISSYCQTILFKFYFCIFWSICNDIFACSLFDFTGLAIAIDNFFLLQLTSNYIYIYAFSRRFYPKRLTVHSGYTVFFFISMCVPWELNPRPFALLTQRSTTEPQTHSTGFQQCFKGILHFFWK